VVLAVTGQQPSELVAPKALLLSGFLGLGGPSGDAAMCALRRRV
jgi:hypothetical protein